MSVELFGRHYEFIGLFATARTTEDVFEYLDQECENVVSKNVENENDEEQDPVNLGMPGLKPFLDIIEL